MASIVCLYGLPGYRQFALLAMMRLFQQHNEKDCWKALHEFNREWNDAY